MIIIRYCDHSGQIVDEKLNINTAFECYSKAIKKFGHVDLIYIKNKIEYCL